MLRLHRHGDGLRRLGGQAGLLRRGRGDDARQLGEFQEAGDGRPARDAQLRRLRLPDGAQVGPPLNLLIRFSPRVTP